MTSHTFLCVHLHPLPSLKVGPVLHNCYRDEKINDNNIVCVGLPKTKQMIMGGKYGISRGTFFQGIEIVALTTVRATI